MKKNTNQVKPALEDRLSLFQKVWQSFVKFWKKIFKIKPNSNKGKRSRRQENSPISNYATSLEMGRDRNRSVDGHAPFLLGLEDIDNLEFLTTKELIAEIEWTDNSQEILTASEADLTLLDDLLVNFPDA